MLADVFRGQPLQTRCIAPQRLPASVHAPEVRQHPTEAALHEGEAQLWKFIEHALAQHAGQMCGIQQRELPMVLHEGARWPIHRHQRGTGPLQCHMRTHRQPVADRRLVHRPVFLLAEQTPRIRVQHHLDHMRMPREAFDLGHCEVRVGRDPQRRLVAPMAVVATDPGAGDPVVQGRRHGRLMLRIGERLVGEWNDDGHIHPGFIEQLPPGRQRVGTRRTGRGERIQPPPLIRWCEDHRGPQ